MWCVLPHNTCNFFSESYALEFIKIGSFWLNYSLKTEMWTLWDALRWSTCILFLLICFALLLYSNIVVTCIGHPAGIYSFWVTYCRFLYCVWRNLSVDCCGIYSTNNTIKWYGVHLSVPAWATAVGLAGRSYWSIAAAQHSSSAVCGRQMRAVPRCPRAW